MMPPAFPSADIAQIRNELAREKSHITTMNFIVWIDREENRGWVIQRAIKISEKHPSRTIILDASPGRIGASVRPLDPNDPTRQSTFIDIGVADIPPQEACEIATSLEADVPTVLCWSAESLGEDTAFRCFFAGGNLPVAVVDSSLGVRDATTILELAQFYQEHSNVSLRDLAWMRLHLWQDIVAHFFDDPALREELFSIRMVRIVAGSDAEALYLGGWLASRLGWTAIARDQFADRNGNPVAFEHERGGQARRIYSVALTTATSIYQASVDEGDASVVRVWAEGANARDVRLVPVQAIDTASLVERAALEDTGTDEIFETALRMVQTLIDG
ncbi:MAG: OpcA/G6PD domain-containing protein [Candidatus Lustribacter sp.]